MLEKFLFGITLQPLSAEDDQMDGLNVWAFTTWADIVLHVPTIEKDTRHVTSMCGLVQW